jgi:hypothetical protein
MFSIHSSTRPKKNSLTRSIQIRFGHQAVPFLMVTTKGGWSLYCLPVRHHKTPDASKVWTRKILLLLYQRWGGLLLYKHYGYQLFTWLYTIHDSTMYNCCRSYDIEPHMQQLDCYTVCLQKSFHGKVISSHMSNLCWLEPLHVIFWSPREIDPFSPLRWEGFHWAFLEATPDKPVEILM